jgi:ABC-type phosphate transport system auxiliary subunit
MPDWVLFFVVVVGIPVVMGVLKDMHGRSLKHRERRMEIEAQVTAEKAAQYAAQTERLEQRVRVLERIVTDKGIVVADQIEALRDKPLN